MLRSLVRFLKWFLALAELIAALESVLVLQDSLLLFALLKYSYSLVPFDSRAWCIGN